MNNWGEITCTLPDPNDLLPSPSKHSGDAGLFRNGQIVNLTSPAQRYPVFSFAGAINDFGEVAGVIHSNGYHLYIYKPGQRYLTITNVPISPSSLNNLGDITGVVPLPDGFSSAGVLYRNGVITYLGNPSGLPLNVPSAINDWEQIVGTSTQGSSPPSQAFYWQNGWLQLLDTPTD
jgi:hypothetical protein